MAEDSQESFSIPFLMNNSASCAAYLRFMPVHALEKAPGESHDEAAKRLLDAFKKGDLKIYQNNPDYRLKNVVAKEGASLKDKASVAARIDGMIGDTQAKKKMFVVLEGEERIQSFISEVLQYHHELHSSIGGLNTKVRIGLSLLQWSMLLTSPTNFVHSYLGMGNTISAFNIPLAAIMLQFLPYAPVTPWRLNRKLPKQLKNLSSVGERWMYSSSVFSVNSVLSNNESSAAHSDSSVARQALNNDYESVASQSILFIPVSMGIPLLLLVLKMQGVDVSLNDTLKKLYDLKPYKRVHVVLDHLYMWDENEQKPVLIIGFRLYDKKPKNLKSAKQRESESSWALDANAAEG